MLRKVLDCLEKKVSMMIWTVDCDDLLCLAKGMNKIGLKRFKYEVYKGYGLYMIEVKMPISVYYYLEQYLMRKKYHLYGSKGVYILAKVK